MSFPKILQRTTLSKTRIFTVQDSLVQFSNGREQHYAPGLKRVITVEYTKMPIKDTGIPLPGQLTEVAAG